MSHPLTPIEVSGTFKIPDCQYTHFFGDVSNEPQRFTFTIPIPTNSIINDGNVFYCGYWIGKVNESDASKVDICNVEILSCNKDDEGFKIEFRRVE